jgi:pSer/pThr/pTyr-binding forkhead associated (FHA) protein
MSRLQTFNRDMPISNVSDWGELLDAEVTAGAGTPEQKSWSLVRPVTLIGFSRHAHLCVQGVGVEAVHAALLNTGDAIILVSLISRHGVFVNNERVRTRVMRSGESFCLGSCLLRLDLGRSALRIEPTCALRLPEIVRLRMTRPAEQEWSLESVGSVIGRRPGCDVRLPSKEALPLHALLTRVGRQVVLASLAADKPLRVNGGQASVCPLRSGDTLTIWPVKLAMTFGRDEARPREQPHTIVPAPSTTSPS